MSKWFRRLTVPAVLLAVAAGVAVARDDEKKKPAEEKKAIADKPTKAEKPKGATAKVEREPFRTELTLNAVFETAALTEVPLIFDAWMQPGMVPVLSAVEPGSTVKKGDVLLKLDPEKIDRALRDLESDQKLAE